MSGNIDDAEYQTARRKGIQVFRKPFSISEIDKWANDIEQTISPTQRLPDLFLKKNK